MIEALIALIVMMFALTIVYIFPSKLVELTKTLQIKSDIYDLAYSIAEESVIATTTNNATITTTINDIEYTYTLEYATSTSKNEFFTNKTNFATVTVFPNISENGIKDKLKISLNFIPKKGS